MKIAKKYCHEVKFKTFSIDIHVESESEARDLAESVDRILVAFSVGSKTHALAMSIKNALAL